MADTSASGANEILCNVVFVKSEQDVYLISTQTFFVEHCFQTNGTGCCMKFFFKQTVFLPCLHLFKQVTDTKFRISIYLQKPDDIDEEKH